MEMNLTLKIDLSWLEDIYAKDKNDIDQMIDAHAKIYKLLNNDFEIAQLCRELKRGLHHTLMTTDFCEYKNPQKLYEAFLTTANRINALRYYTVYADDERFTEKTSLHFIHELPFTQCVNDLPDADLRSKLWPLIVYPTGGTTDIDTMADEIIGYINQAYDVQQDNVYDALYALRFKGLEYDGVETVLESLVSISYKIMFMAPLAQECLNIAKKMKEAAEKAEVEKAAKPKRTRKKKEDSEDVKPDQETDPELN